MKRILIAAALAVLALAASSPAARADQTLRFNIVGAGHITGAGIDCSRDGGGPLQGDCDEHVVDGPDHCDEFCVPTPGSLLFQAQDAGGFHFTGWSHPQCAGARNPCMVEVVPGRPNPDLTITATFADVQPPTVALPSPADGGVVRGVIPVSATAADNAGVTRLTYRVRGNPFQTFEVAPFATTLDTRTLVDGPAAISATANDAVGLSAAATTNVTIDNTKPSLTVTGPDGQTLGLGVTPTWAITAADATTAVTVRCSVVPADQPASFDACTSATTERLVNQGDGRYALTVRATDAAGNFAEQTRTFGVDTGPPETTIASGPADGASTLETALTWGFASSEPGSTFECRVYLTVLGPDAFGPCSAPAAHSVAGLPPGSYTIEVRATDSFGNVDATPAKRTVTVASTPLPPVTIVHQNTVVQRVVVVALTFTYRHANKRTTTLNGLLVRSVPVGSTVTARCPKGCAKKTLVKRNVSGIVSLSGLATKPLKVKTKITVTISNPGAVSAVKVLQIQKGKAPTVASYCQPPGAKKPLACA